MANVSTRLLAPLLGYLSRLRFPTLMLLSAALFLADLFLPDAIPFIDEIFFGLLTAIFASWKRRRDGSTSIESDLDGHR